MRSILDDHVAAALLTDHICDLVLDLNLLKLLFRRFYSRFQIRVKILYYRLPVYGSFLHPVQEPLHVRREICLHDAREGLLHHVVDYLSQLRQIQIFIFLDYVTAGDNRRNRRRVGAGTSDSQFLQSLYEGCLRIMGRRLSKVLLTFKFLQRERRLRAEPL